MNQDLDVRLSKRAQAELDWDPQIAARSIHVAVLDGTVELSGRISSYVGKWRAERALERVRGVRGVVNEIQVIPHVEPDDAELARLASARLAATGSPSIGRVSARSNAGWLALEGEVDWDFERRAAADAVRTLPGVRGITNAITIRPRHVRRRRGAPALSALIDQALRRDAMLDASRVAASVEGGHVTLRGAVETVAEAREAEQRAWAAPGVWSVDNLIRVEPQGRLEPEVRATPQVPS
jgi:osmotically-inducible protein OsmY